MFAIVVDREESSWTVASSEDIVSCGETREQVDVSLEGRRMNWREKVGGIKMWVQYSRGTLSPTSL